MENGFSGLVKVDGKWVTAKQGTSVPANGWKYWCLVLLAVLLLGAAGVAPMFLSTGRTLWVDSVYGSDVAGRRGVASSPFLTIPTAVTNALPGDTVHVLPGTNDCGTNGILRRNVNYFFEPGSLVIWSNVNMSADVFCLFDDRQTGPTTNVIDGQGRFFGTAYRTGTDEVNSNLRGLVSVTNTGTELHFTASKMEVQAPTTLGAGGYFGALNVWDGKVWLDVDEIVDSYPGDGGVHGSVALGMYWQLGEIHARCRRLVTQNYYGLWGHDPSAGSSRANFWYDGSSVLSSNFVGVYVDGTTGVDSPNYRSWFNIKDVSGSTLGYSFLGQSRVYITGQKAGSSTGTALDSAAVLWAEIEKLSGTNGLLTLRGGEGYVRVQQYEDLAVNGGSGVAKVSLLSGNNQLLGGNYRAGNTNATYFMRVAGGTNVLQGLTLDMSKAGTTNGWGVYMDSTNGEALTLQNCSFKIGGSTSNSILATNVQTVRVRGNFFSSTNVHPNVQLWGGWVEAQNRMPAGPGWYMAEMGRRPTRWVINSGTGTSFTGIGDSGTISTFGTAFLIPADSIGPASVGMPTAGSVNSQSSVSGNLNYRVGRNPESAAWGGPTNLASFTYWHVLTDQAASVVTGANPAGNYSGFRYDSISSDATYKFITKDGATQTVTDTGVALGNGYHSTRVVLDDLALRAIGYIDGIPVATNKANLPTAGTMVRYVVSVTTNVGATNCLRMGYCANASD